MGSSGVNSPACSAAALDRCNTFPEACASGRLFVKNTPLFAIRSHLNVVACVVDSLNSGNLGVFSPSAAPRSIDSYDILYRQRGVMGMKVLLIAMRIYNLLTVQVLGSISCRVYSHKSAASE